MHTTPSPAGCLPATERRKAERRKQISHYRAQLAEQHLSILLPAVRLAIQDLARSTPAGLRIGSAHEALTKALAEIGGAA